MLPPERGRMYLYQVAGRAQSPLVKPDLLDQGKGWVGGGGLGWILSEGFTCVKCCSNKCILTQLCQEVMCTFPWGLLSILELATPRAKANIQACLTRVCHHAAHAYPTRLLVPPHLYLEDDGISLLWGPSEYYLLYWATLRWPDISMSASNRLDSGHHQAFDCFSSPIWIR